MEELKYFEEIEAYVEGDLTKEDKKGFELKLSNNSALKQEYDAYLATQKVARILGLQHLRETAIPPKKSRRSYRPWLAAASFLLIILLGGLINSYVNYRPATLALQYQQAPVRTGTTADNTILNQAWDAADDRDFQTALQLLSPSRGDEIQEENAQALYVYALLAAEQGSAARQYLLQIGSPATLNPQLSWYLVQAHLQTGDRTAAMTQIELILAESAHPFYENAQELKQQLNSIWGRWY